MLSSLFLKILRDYRISLLFWGLGFIALSFYLMYFYPFISKTPDILRILENLPPIIKNFIGNTAKLTSPEGFFNVQPFSMMAPLLFLIFSILKGGNIIAGEMEKGTLDLLMANPLPRWRLVVEKYSALGMSLFYLSITFWIGMVSSSLIFNVKINFLRLAAAIISCFALGLFFASLTLTLGCLSLRKKMSYGIVIGLAFVTYMINAYAPMVASLRPYQVFSPFYYYNGASPMIYGLNIAHFSILIGLSVIFFLLSIFIFERKNIL